MAWQGADNKCEGLDFFLPEDNGVFSRREIKATSTSRISIALPHVILMMPFCNKNSINIDLPVRHDDCLRETTCRFFVNDDFGI